MIGIIFHMEDDERSVFSDLTIWRRIINNWNVDFYIVVDLTKNNTHKNWRDDVATPCLSVNTLGKAIDFVEEKHNGNVKYVYLNPNMGEDLRKYQHPKGNVYYIIGADTGGVPKEFGTLKHDNVNIKTNGCDLWSLNCLTILLYDRSTKEV